MIQTEHLTKAFGDLEAVHDLNLEIKGGELFAFLGPNGAGKTTTIKLLAGLLKPTAGRAIVGGFDIQRQAIEARRLLSYVPDLPFLYDKLEPMEFMQFIGQLYDMEPARIRHNAEEWFERFELNEVRNQLIETLSHGIRQRLAIASALLHEPRVLIIDEPMVGLDPRSARTVKDVFRECARAGMTVFLSTHILHVAEELADHVGILNRGRLITVGTMEQVSAAGGRGGALEDVFLTLTRQGGENGMAPVVSS